MGRQEFSCIGYGMTEQEALNDARDKARDEYGHQEGYSGTIQSATELHSKCVKQPKFAKSCKVEKHVQKGARKWETVFVIAPTWDSNCRTRKEMRDCTQAQAIQAAKNMALANNTEYEVKITKRISQGSNNIANITPKQSEMGKWKFWGMARC